MDSLLVNSSQKNNLYPVNLIQTTQEGDIYTWQALAFNAYGQATDVSRYNSIAGQSGIEKATTYLNDPALWVLGLPLQVTNVTKGEIESTNTYTSSDALQSRARFGQTLMNYGYDGQGQLTSFTDPNNHTTTLGSYKLGIPQSIGYPDGTSVSLVVDDFGQISSLTDQAGSTTNYSYDAIGRITGITYPAGDEVAWFPKSFSYAYVTTAERGLWAGHWRRTTSKGGAVTTTYFDAMLRPVLSDTAISGTANSDISTRTDYDWKGQKIFVSYPVSGTPDLSGITSGATSIYDALGRVIQLQQASELGTLTSSTAYLAGARKQVTDPKGYVTTTSYQVFDQPSYDAVIQVQAPEGITQAISRDLYGNPLSITQSGLYGTESDNVTKWLVYDSYHRLCRSTEPESGSEVTAYDAANNVAWTASGLSFSGSVSGCGQEQVPAAAQATRSYDAMNRLLTLAPPAGTQSTSYTYDALGNVATANSGITAWAATRNTLGQLTAESLGVTGNGSKVIRYAHDAYGSVRLVSYPDGTVVDYAPDALGRATQVGSYANNLNYFPDGDLQSFTYGNGTSYLAQKNARQLLSNFSYGKTGTLNVSEDYTYDGNGNITNITDLASGQRTKALSYDTLNRLTQAQANGLWGTESYSYDPLNNIRSRVSGGQTFTYNYDASKTLLSSITQGATPVVTLQYDNRGNVNLRNGAALVFDQKNQLTGIPGYDSYAYDTAGRRVLKTPASGAASTYYFYTQAGQLLYQFDAAANTDTDYLYLGKKLIAKTVQASGSAPDQSSIPAMAPGTYSPLSSATGSYTVSWYGVANAATYELQEQVNGGAWATIYSGAGQLWGMASKGAGTYGYRTRACNTQGCGPWSQPSTVVVNGQSPPVAPTTSPLLSVPAVSTTASYAVRWTGVDGASSYVLQEQSGTGAWAQVYSGPEGVWQAIGKPNGSYGYRVQACNAGGCGPWSEVGTLNVKNPNAALPAILQLLLD
ncbi:hypothetical protein [Dyella subtropica]|uniref:hypothetical protein n=1 Tax=Dyella subtropica TaxID=2992127 RepID=UPI002251C258|nr:hypothetical protein [Dyella subtropica]